MIEEESLWFEDKDSKRLFLRYAVPCHENPKELAKDLEKKNKIDLNIKDHFSMAMNMLKITAEEQGKNSIDKETVREYFWVKHGEVLKENSTEEDIERCLVLPGEIVEEEEVRLVNNDFREVKTPLIDDSSIGSWVAVHYNYAAENIDKRDRKKLTKVFESLQE